MSNPKERSSSNKSPSESEHKIPPQWIQATLNQVCSKITDGSHNPPKGSILGHPMLSAKNIQSGKVLFTESHRLISDADFENEDRRTQIQSGDILLTIVGTIGRTAVINSSTPKFALQRSVAVLGPQKICSKYLEHAINDGNFQQQLTQHAKGTAQKGVYLKTLRNLDVPIPSLAEQKVIADKLDELLAQVDTLKTRLDAIPAILKRFRQSVLAAAVSGKLTEEWRSLHPISDINNFSEKAKAERKTKGFRETKHTTKLEVDTIPFDIPNTWQWFRLGHIANKITDGAHNTPKTHSSGHPYIMAKDLTGGKLDFSEKRYISEKDHRELYLKCHPEAGDLLIVNIGAGTGNNVLIDVNFQFSFKNIAIIKKPSFVDKNYLKYFFDSQKQRIFSEQTKGGAQPFLSLTVLNEIPFALPPIEEQAEIVRRVEQLFTYADQVEQQVKNAQARVNQLTQSILAKAFRGELTEQWRQDNPDLISGDNSAAALLERIKAERAAAKPAKKTKGRKSDA
jgi:type I restriction enzyme S subunit